MKKKKEDLKQSYPKIHTVIEKEKERLLKLENQKLAKNERLRVLINILSEPITYYELNRDKKFYQKGKTDLLQPMNIS